MIFKWAHMNWVGDKSPGYMRKDDFIPCDCEMCVTFVEIVTIQGLTMQLRNGNWEGRHPSYSNVSGGQSGDLHGSDGEGWPYETLEYSDYYFKCVTGSKDRSVIICREEKTRDRSRLGFPFCKEHVKYFLCGLPETGVGMYEGHMPMMVAIVKSALIHTWNIVTFIDWICGSGTSGTRDMQKLANGGMVEY